MRSRSGVGAFVLFVAMLAAGCTSGGAKAGGSGEPVVLQLSSSGASAPPAVDYFMKRVGEVSGGALRVKLIHVRGVNFEPGVEQDIVRDVAAGKADLAWVGTRVFDTFGLNSFQALTAPMLIDSYPLERAVIASEIPGQMLQSLDRLSLKGLAVLAETLRRPVAGQHPLLGPADWNGITFAAIRSNGEAAAIRALGASPADAWGGPLGQGLAAGEIRGAEKGLGSYYVNTMEQVAPYVTANVNLWPQTIALVANADRFSRLNAGQRRWLEQSGQDAALRSTSLAQPEDQIVADVCEAGARLANASETDLAGLRQAFLPVYADMERDPQTKAFIRRIEQFKASTPPGPGLSIPEGCTGEAPLFAAGTEAGPVSALNGTYRWTLTKEDALAHGTDADKSPANLATLPSILTMTLKDGKWTLAHGAVDGLFIDASDEPYSVDGDRIVFHWGAGILTFTFTVDGQGNLDLTPVLPMDPGDQYVWATKQWTKIAGPRPTDVSGTYRWTFTKEEGLASSSADIRKQAVGFPVTFTMIMKDGSWTLANQAPDGPSSEGPAAAYFVFGDRISFQDLAGTNVLTFTFTLDAQGNLDMKPVLPMDPGDQFVLSSKEWTRIG